MLSETQRETVRENIRELALEFSYIMKKKACFFLHINLSGKIIPVPNMSIYINDDKIYDGH